MGLVFGPTSRNPQMCSSDRLIWFRAIIFHLGGVSPDDDSQQDHVLVISSFRLALSISEEAQAYVVQSPKKHYSCQVPPYSG